MKVVINDCFGGFGLSKDALTALEKSPCPHIKRFSPEEYYGKDWEARMREDIERNSHLFWTLFVDGKVVTEEHRHGDRSCPHLVAVVKQLGRVANGACASLKIVNVPKDVKWVVEEYDGSEWVAEEHRTWR